MCHCKGPASSSLENTLENDFAAEGENESSGDEIFNNNKKTNAKNAEKKKASETQCGLGVVVLPTKKSANQAMIATIHSADDRGLLPTTQCNNQYNITILFI